MSNLIKGQVLTRTRGGVVVLSGSGDIHDCRVRGKGKKIGMPVPGDWVKYEKPSRTKEGWVQEILPRESLYERYVFGRIKEVAANMQRLVLLVTPYEPIVSPRLVDRMLVGASVGRMDALIVLNKADIFKAEEIEEYIAPFRSAGYPIHIISSVTGEGVQELENDLSSGLSLLAGASGVGKSTLLNRLIEDLDLDTSGISDATGRGVHTTTFTKLYNLPNGGVVADSPGVREFFPVVEAKELRFHYPEFEDISDNCAFNDCQHLEDDDCAVRAAVEEGKIHPVRYESYKMLHKSISEGPKRGRGGDAVHKVW